MYKCDNHFVYFYFCINFDTFVHEYCMLFVLNRNKSDYKYKGLTHEY